MKQALLLICIALCVCAATAAENEAPISFTEYMSTAKASAMSEYRYGMETESMCFKVTDTCSTKNTKGDIDIKNIQEQLACSDCPRAYYGPQYGGNDDTRFIDITVPLSLCTWTAFESDKSDKSDCHPVPNRNGVSACGTYQGTCYLDEDKKGGCKFPDTCEDTVLTIQGAIYLVDNAIRVGPESDPTKCGNNRRSVGTDQPANKEPAPTETAPQAEVKSITEDKKVKVGKAYVWSGTYTVMAHHPLKFKSGWHQFSEFKGTIRNENYDDYKNNLKLSDGVHKFDFMGDVKHPY